ncbi:hypothetical protein ACH47Z_40475 [Streptomyces sp. NPDC020192]|uniref:hypothetical protein n=1 Tax=Streptomyces sp. NPDC020192 TaxID=3365066 RepID=UPI0037B770B4
MSGGSSGADLEASRDALKRFVGKVDAVLSTLEKSAGNPARVGEQTIRQTSLSSGPGGFAEAEDLYSAFNTVHERLTTLSKTLHLQIEATNIAVMGAKGTFEGLEEEQRRRFYEIQTEIADLKSSSKRAGDGETGGY